MPSSYVMFGKTATLTASVRYASILPAVHWRVNNHATIESSSSYTSSHYKSVISWPVTETIEVQAIVHYGDMRGTLIKEETIYAYGN